MPPLHFPLPALLHQLRLLRLGRHAPRLPCPLAAMPPRLHVHRRRTSHERSQTHSTRQDGLLCAYGEFRTPELAGNGAGDLGGEQCVSRLKEKGKVGAVDTVLTDENGVAGECVNATSLSIVAETSDELGASVTSWRERVGGKEECAGFASVRIEEVPAGTTRVEVTGQLDAGMSGMLFIAGV